MLASASDPNLPHNSQAPQVLGACITMLILCTFVVAARFWIRLSLTKGEFGADDWCILVAWVLAAAFDLDPINQVHFGLGQHIYDLPEDNSFAKSLELYYFGEILYFVCVGVTKVAVLLLYLRLATSKTLRRMIWGMMALVITSSFASTLACIFQCLPIHKAWDLAGVVEGSCFNVNALFYANAGLDIVQDLIIYILPLRMLYQLQLPKRQKWALMLVFAVGGFVVVTGMIRLYYLKGAQASTDPSYDNVGGAIWSAIECNMGVICASLPHFKPLFDRFFPNLMGRSRGTAKIEGPKSGPSLRGAGNYVKHPSQKDTEFELETQNGQPGWKDTYSGKFDNNITAVEGGKSTYSGRSSEERLRGEEAHDRSGIYKSTKVVLTRSAIV